MTAFVVSIIAICSLVGLVEGVITGKIQDAAMCAVIFLSAISPVILRKKSEPAQ